MKNISKQLKTIRINSGKTQVQIAKVLKLKASQSVNNWENGQTTVPAKHVKKMAKAMKVDPEMLLGLILTGKNATYRKAARL